MHECAGADDRPPAPTSSACSPESGPVSVLGYLGEAVEDPGQRRSCWPSPAPHALGGDLSVDGAIGSRTASLSADYHDAPAAAGPGT